MKKISSESTRSKQVEDVVLFFAGLIVAWLAAFAVAVVLKMDVIYWYFGTALLITTIGLGGVSFYLLHRRARKINQRENQITA